MKKLYYLVSLAAVMLFAGCSSDIEEFDANDYSKLGDAKTIKVNVSNGDETRFNCENLELMHWTEHDPLFVTVVDDQGNATVETLEIQSFEGKNAVFSAPTTKGVKYQFYFSGAGSYVTDVQDIDYMGQMQLDFTSNNIKNYMLLQSDVLTEKSSSTILLKNLTKVMRIKVMNMPAELEGKSNVAVTLKMNGFDVAKTTLYPAMNNTQDNIIYMSFNHPKMGNILYKDEEIAVEFFDGTTTYTAKANCTDQKTYMPGKIYTLVVNNTSTDTERALVWQKNESSADTDIKIKFADGYAVPNEFTASDDPYGFNGKLVKNTKKPVIDGFYSFSINAGYFGKPDKFPKSLQGNVNVLEVIVPYNITLIDANAFQNCNKLCKVTFAADIKLSSIGAASFIGCTSLKSIDIPEGVTNLGERAFAASGITSLVIPSSVTTIGEFLMQPAADQPIIITDITVKCAYNETMALKLSQIFGNTDNKYVDGPNCAIHVDSSWNGKTFTKESVSTDCVDTANNKFCDVTYKSVDNIIK